MAANTVFVKTAKGAEHIEQRNRNLPHMLRRLLLLVNGASDVAALQKHAVIVGDVVEMLQELQTLGLIENANPEAASGADRHAGSEKLRAYLVEFAQSLFGADAAPLVQRIGSAGSPRRLEALISECAALVEGMAGRAKAQEFTRNCHELLS